MINLLSAESVLKNKRDYARRRAMTVGSLVIVLMLSGLIINISLLITLWLRTAEASAELARADTRSVQEYGQSSQLAQLAAQRLTVFASLPTAEIAPGAIWTRVADRQPAGITLKSFAYVRGGDGALALSLGGVAATRQTLLDFVAALRVEPIFTNVVSPVSNLIKDRDADFTIELTIKHEPTT